jgi:hypothetical protein
MSDGHSDSANYSRFYEANRASAKKREEYKLEKMCLVLKDETVVPLDEVRLLFSEKYSTGTESSSTDMLSENGSRMFNLIELIREMIRKGLV